MGPRIDLIGFYGGKYKRGVSAQSGLDYGRGGIAGLSTTCPNPGGTRNQWYIWDMLTLGEPDPLYAQFMDPLAMRLGYEGGHLLRLFDTCRRVRVSPDPRQLGLNLGLEDVILRWDSPEYWQKILQLLQSVIVTTLRKNAEELMAGDFRRVYIRPRLVGAGKHIGPNNKIHLADVAVALEVLDDYAPRRMTVVLSPWLTAGDSMGRAKAAANYLQFMTTKEEGRKRAAQLGVEAHDVISLKNVGPGGLIGPGEGSTSTLALLVTENGQLTLLVPDPNLTNVLPGRTIYWVMRLLESELGIPSRYAQVTLTEMCCIQEAILTGNATYAASVRRLGTLKVPYIRTGRRIDHLLRKAMSGKLPGYERYGTLVTL